MQHIPGIKHKATDALSRCPVGPIPAEPMLLPDDVAALEQDDQETPCFHDALMAICRGGPVRAEADDDMWASISAILQSLESVTF